MTERNPSDQPYKTSKPYLYVAGLALILVLIAYLGIGFDGGEVEKRVQHSFNRVQVWFGVLVLMALFGVVAGRGITGRWRGILIDSRNKMSVSRLQILVWSLLVLSALFTAVLTNVGLGWQSPLEIDVPAQLWILMGISTASAVGSPLVLAVKDNRQVSRNQKQTAVVALEKIGRDQVDEKSKGVVVRNKEFDAARWGDLLMGDEFGNAARIDVGKLQMLMFTFVLVLGYGAAIGALFRGGDVVTALPPMQDGMNVLLGISHTGYLSAKAAPNTEEVPDSA